MTGIWTVVATRNVNGHILQLPTFFISEQVHGFKTVEGALKIVRAIIGIDLHEADVQKLT